MTASSTLKDPIEFCPAVACAAAIVRLEGFIDHLARLHADALVASSSDLLHRLEAVIDDLLLAADEARDRLSKVEAVSAAGAMAQLLASIRDIRVQDDAERERAKDLEAKAVRFLSDAQLFDSTFCNKLSRTKLSEAAYVSKASGAAFPSIGFQNR